MEPMLSLIPTRSRQKALDWSLVLLSQGIESTIERAEDGASWALGVRPSDLERAIQVLRQYKVENRAPAWRQPLPWNELIFDWRSLAWFLLLLMIFAGQQSPDSPFTSAGLMDTQAVRSGQWWRLFTAVTLHRDLAHLVSNMTVGLVLLGLAMGSFGSGVGLLGSYLAGAAGNVVGLLLYSGAHRSLGASGMVFGALGLLTGQMSARLRAGLTPRQVAVRGILSGILLLVLFGLNPDSDVIAHLGGFGMGGILGAILARWPQHGAKPIAVNRVAEVLCAALVGVTWWLALRIGH